LLAEGGKGRSGCTMSR